MAKNSRKVFAGRAKRDLRFAYQHALVNYFFSGRSRVNFQLFSGRSIRIFQNFFWKIGRLFPKIFWNILRSFPSISKRALECADLSALLLVPAQSGDEKGVLLSERKAVTSHRTPQSHPSLLSLKSLSNSCTRSFNSFSWPRSCGTRLR